MKTAAPVDFEELDADSGAMLFLMNWETRDAPVELTVPLARPARKVYEVTTGQTLAGGASPLRISAELPPGGVRVFRIDY